MRDFLYLEVFTYNTLRKAGYENILPFLLCFHKLVVSLQMLSAHDGWEAYRGMRSCWVEHYIWKGVTDALFLDNRTTTSTRDQKHC